SQAKQRMGFGHDVPLSGCTRLLVPFCGAPSKPSATMIGGRDSAPHCGRYCMDRRGESSGFDRLVKAADIVFVGGLPISSRAPSQALPGPMRVLLHLVLLMGLCLDTAALAQ